MTTPINTKRQENPISMYFSDYYRVDTAVLAGYGAFDISLFSDLPLFIDPFLLFNSSKPEYQALHEDIIRYLEFLRDRSLEGSINDGLKRAWYYFSEVRQNWLGFTFLGNKGHALGHDFADALDKNLLKLFEGEEGGKVSRGRHLEKLSLIRGGVGKDCISDFTTNLIKGYLLEYTQTFAMEHLNDDQRRKFRVRRVRFNYTTKSWEDGEYTLPMYGEDFVLLTPEDMLTRDDTWINRSDLIRGFDAIPPAIEDEALRAQVSNYFSERLIGSKNQKDREVAIQATIERYPELLEYYIALKELSGGRASEVSADRVTEIENIFVTQLRELISDLDQKADFYSNPQTSYGEALARVKIFKHYVEHQDGYRLINREGRPPGTEGDVQLFFGLVMVGTTFDVNREPNNGRGPVDFKLSKGAFDKSLIEFKLASNTKLKRNLEKQVAIYEEANQTKRSVKVIVVYTESDARRVAGILKELNLNDTESVVVIDARSDNKPSGSKA
jgi:hypothetical protein